MPQTVRGVQAKAQCLPAYGKVLMLGIVVALSGCAAKRLDPPPAGEAYALPWGAVPVESWEPALGNRFKDNIVDALAARVKALRGQDPAAPIPYKILAISGGGSRGAYGAGVLSGWIVAGRRPNFDVVTGISTGALIATFALH